MVICALVSSTLINMYLRSVPVKGNDLERRELGERGDICQYYGSEYSHTLFLVVPPPPLHCASILTTVTWRTLATSSIYAEQEAICGSSTQRITRVKKKKKKEIPPRVVCLPVYLDLLH